MAIIEAFSGETRQGTANADELFAIGNGILIQGLAGSDTLFAADGTGNNTLEGGADGDFLFNISGQNNLLSGGLGKDYLIAELGGSSLRGDQDRDFFGIFVEAGQPTTIIEDFTQTFDLIGLSILGGNINGFGDLIVQQQNTDTIVQSRIDNSNLITLRNFSQPLTAEDFVFNPPTLPVLDNTFFVVDRGSLINIQSATFVTLVNINPAPQAPNNPELRGFNFNNNFLDININSTNIEQTIIVDRQISTSLILPTLANNVSYNSYFIFGQQPGVNVDQWYSFLYDGETGAKFYQLDFNGDGIIDQSKTILKFIDGKKGDSDLNTNNGSITNSGGASFIENVTFNFEFQEVILGQKYLDIVALDLGDQSISGVSTTVNFALDVVSTTATFVNEVGVFRVDRNNNIIDPNTGALIAPGDASYIATALSQSEVIFSSLNENIISGSLSRKVQFSSEDRLVFFLVSDDSVDQLLATPNADFSNVFFSLQELNADGIEHLTVTADTANSNRFILGWEETFGGGDLSFDDVTLSVELTSQEQLSLVQFIGNTQGDREGELVDLSKLLTQQTLTTTITVDREAAFDNFVGFYRVDNQQGDVNGISPGTVGYAEAALAQQVTNIELTAVNLQTQQFTSTLQGGSYYAPFLIVDGTPATVGATFDNVYFPFLDANPDGFDRIRLLGDNAFGFEDLPVANSDRDFDDIIVRFTDLVVA